MVGSLQGPASALTPSEPGATGGPCLLPGFLSSQHALELSSDQVLLRPTTPQEKTQS